ncbi:MAG: SusC/RagA family TonB-linked outer membrane protein [Candidatus Pseudobacter hemicellulosilyticus]|uniref:SusC/RagA family TonB-linked outer membrane protein n=1 Tax=Candidatus Pseudobacter hemicellulosilyticus TaxID=3121375 RepID=A0AAJ5WVN2_9BACT|nr:MAG: SusC/RagA family TonB-linked outer membrane protein [Pseudobacter sp.]
MKLTAYLLLICSMHVCATTSSQTITWSGRDVSLNKLFNVIKQQTGYGVFGNASLLKQSRKVSISAVEMPLADFLNLALKEQPLTYRILDKTIVLYRKYDDPDDVSATSASRDSSLHFLTLQAMFDPIKGKVTTEAGLPLAGVSISIKGEKGGVSTDEAGNFSINAQARQVLVFTYIGMESQQLRISDPSKTLSIVLKPAEAAMKDVVVTGYSNLRKESFTGNSIKVEREQILKVAQRNVIDVLQVFDPSFRIEMNNIMGSDPNTMPQFYIRGRSGIGVKELDQQDISQAALQNNPNLPIFIMDGYEVPSSRVYDYDPMRIKSITILKDAAATAIYGSRAANGVVVIETIAPIPGKLRVNYNLVSSLTAPDLSEYNLMNAEEKLEAERLAGFYVSTVPATQNQLENEYIRKRNQLMRGVNTDWISQPVTNELNQKHTLALDGGSNDLRFNILLKYDRQNGVMKESKRERMGAGLILEYRFNNFQLRNDLSYDAVKATNSPYGSFSDYTWKAPYDEIVDRTGKYLKNTTTWHGGGTNQLNLVNPLYEVYNTQNFSRNGYNALINNTSLVWRVLPQLQIKGQLSVNKTDNEAKEFYDPASGRFVVNANTDLATVGSLSMNNSSRLSVNTNLFANYVNNINGHNMNFSAGINTVENKSNGESLYFTGFPTGSQSSPNFAARIVNLPSYSDNHTRMFGSFLALNYSFNDIYLLDVSSRLDGSSEFGSKKRYAPFYSLGAGINLHRYAFMANNKWISRARITGSFGQLGKTNFQPYAAKDNYVISEGWYRTGVGASLMYMGNPNLTWEKTNTYDLVMDLGLLQDLINVNVNWYNKLTKDLVNDVDLPLSAGFSAYKDNIGEVRNRGIEINVRANVYRSKDVLIAVYGNFASNKNTLVDISRSLQNYNQRVDNQYKTYNQYTATNIDSAKKYSTPHTKYVVGGSLTSIFGMQSLGINPMDGKEIFLKRDGTITYDWNAADQVIIGDAAPKGQGAFGINFSYKGFTLFTSCLYQYGSQEYNYTLLNKVENVDLYNRNTDRRVLTDRWRKPGDVTNLKDIKESLYTTRPTSRFIQDYNAITINSISLGYNFTQEQLKHMGLSMCRIQVSTNNVATISSVRQERGLSYPFARTFDLSLNVGL